MQIRKAKKEDVNDILFYDIKAWNHKYNNILPEAFLQNICTGEEEKKHALNKRKNEINKFIVADDNDKIIGIAKYDLNNIDLDDTIGQIKFVYSDNIDAKELLLNEVKNTLKNDGYSKAAITVTENNDINYLINNGASKKGEYNFTLNDIIYKEDIYLFEL